MLYEDRVDAFGIKLMLKLAGGCADRDL